MEEIGVLEGKKFLFENILFVSEQICVSDESSQALIFENMNCVK